MNNLTSLRFLLILDAITCAVFAILLLGAFGALSQMMHLPDALLFWAGAVLVPTAIFMAVAAFGLNAPLWAGRIVVFGNLAWIILSLGLPVFGFITPNGLGWAFVVAQAAAVAVLTILEYRAFASRPVAQGAA
jgi:hypothetical protein